MSIKPEIAEKLAKIVGEDNSSTATAELFVYSFDGGFHRRMPDAVARPGTQDEVRRIILLANEHEVPLVPRGAGTGLCGAAVPIAGGIVVDMQRMNALKEVRVDGIYAVAEPGVICDHFNAAIGSHGFFVPGPASSEVATLGGNAGENSGGPHCLKYGVTGNHVLGMTVVLSDGQVVELGGPALDPPGYDLRGVLIGSEGTLGIFTELVVRIMPAPESVVTLLAVYDTHAEAAESVSAVIAAGIVPD